MSIVSDLVAILRAVPSVAAVVGARVYPGVAPQGVALPNLVVTKTSEREGYVFEGADDVPEARVVLIARAETFPVADALGDAVVAALKNYRTAPLDVFRDLVDATDYVEADGKHVHLRMVGFVVHHRTD